jgi:hypothetical protein
VSIDNSCLEEGAVDAPIRGVALLRAGVDGVHTATVTVLAAVSPRHRRAALMNAAVAAAFCGLGVVGAQ